MSILQSWRTPEAAARIACSAHPTHAPPQSLPSSLYSSRPNHPSAVTAPLSEDTQPWPLGRGLVCWASCAVQTLPSGAAGGSGSSVSYTSSCGSSFDSSSSGYCSTSSSASSITVGTNSWGHCRPRACRPGCASSTSCCSCLGMCNVASHVLLTHELCQDGGITQNTPGRKQDLKFYSHKLQYNNKQGLIKKEICLFLVYPHGVILLYRFKKKKKSIIEAPSKPNTS